LKAEHLLVSSHFATTTTNPPVFQTKVMVVSIPHPLIALVLGCGGFISGLSGFGSAIMSQLLWGLLGSFITHFLKSDGDPMQYYPIGAFKVLYPILSLTDTISASYYVYKDYKKIKWSVAKLFVLTVPGVVLGITVLDGAAPTALASLLGLFFLSVATQKLYEDFAHSSYRQEREIAKSEPAVVTVMEAKPEEKQTSQEMKELPEVKDEKKAEDPAEEIVIEEYSFCAKFKTWDLNRIQTLWGIFSALATGLIGGMFGMGGPPGILYLRYLGLDKTVVRVTFAVVTVITNPTRIFLAIPKGIMAIPKWDWYVAGVIGAFSGMSLGFKLHHKVSQKLLMRLMMIMILISSSEFIKLSPMDQVIPIFSMIVVIVCVISLSFALTRFFEVFQPPLQAKEA
jgi:uncharacterized membrane protein YfcA